MQPMEILSKNPEITTINIKNAADFACAQYCDIEINLHNVNGSVGVMDSIQGRF